MPTPLISIITVNYNSGTKLAATCASVAGQAVDYEHLIVDGASSDGSQELGKERAAKDPRIRIISEKDRGIFDAMNKGFALATGQYIFFLGAGDVMLPGSLAEITKHLPGETSTMVYGDVMMGSRRYDGEFTARKLGSANICHQAIFYGRKAVERCGTYECKYTGFADWEYNFRCFGDASIRKIYVPVIVSIFEEGGNSYKGDPTFERDRLDLVRRHMGTWTYLYVASVAIGGKIARRLGRPKKQ
jgi:glycosyltransferase involved in cell wall biosynthesis